MARASRDETSRDAGQNAGRFVLSPRRVRHLSGARAIRHAAAVRRFPVLVALGEEPAAELANRIFWFPQPNPHPSRQCKPRHPVTSVAGPRMLSAACKGQVIAPPDFGASSTCDGSSPHIHELDDAGAQARATPLQLNPREQTAAETTATAPRC